MPTSLNFLVSLLLLCNFLFAGESQTVLTEWLPKGSNFPTRFLDPAAPQQSISMLTYEVSDEHQQVAYVPISVSMRQQFLRVSKQNQPLYELGIEFSIFSQFTIVDVGEAFMGGLQNADYRVSAVGVYQKDSATHFRLSLFHQSSHLGDDYLIRNEITTPTLRTLNYEQVDLTVSKRWGSMRSYTALGYNVSPNTVRERVAIQWGGDLIRSSTKHPGLAWVAAMDVKWYAQNDFHPNLRLGFGAELARKTKTPFKILFTWYDGHLPYSTLEYQKVRLVGLSLFIDLQSSSP